MFKIIYTIYIVSNCLYILCNDILLYISITMYKTFRKLNLNVKNVIYKLSSRRRKAKRSRWLSYTFSYKHPNLPCNFYRRRCYAIAAPSVIALSWYEVLAPLSHSAVNVSTMKVVMVSVMTVVVPERITSSRQCGLPVSWKSVRGARGRIRRVARATAR